ncbi:unnamed protein product [Arabis nemorensis]|uniref:RING-type domain-containing protein n=1 Tax=Arabis nemorensis TaxID=586526 RepID=A0A565BZW7_9BRAS|nr:unnamed protein product [Arabis nemorensis]
MSDSGEDKTFVQESKSGEGETSQNPKKRALEGDEDNQSSKLAKKTEFERTEEEDALPLECPICKNPFLDPIVTKCNHYFCHHCALKHEKENNTCFVCNQPTLGVFNTAVEIKTKIARVREKAKVMVKEVKTMVENAAVIVKEAEAMAADSAKMVANVELIMGVLDTFGMLNLDTLGPDDSWQEVITFVTSIENSAANARDKAEKAAEMVKEANATTETARVEMVKALEVMKNVKWNV